MDLADGFTTYTTNTKTLNGSNGLAENSLTASKNSLQRSMTPAQRQKKFAEVEASVTLAKDSADILLNPEGSLIQKLLLEESVRATSAQMKDNLRTVLVDGPQQFRDSLPFGAGSILPPLPFENQVKPFLAKSDDELKAQQLAEKLMALVSKQQLDRMQRGGTPTSADASSDTTPPAITALLEDVEPEQLAILSRELRESAPQYLPLVGLLGARFTTSLLETAASNIDGALAELETSGEDADAITKATVRGFSSFAKLGANTLSDRVENAVSTTTEESRS